MRITKVVLKGFRNFADAVVKLERNTLIIGANNVGKTNLACALRLLLDKSLSDADIEPMESNFHISGAGKVSETLSITIYFSEATADAVLESLKGNITDDSCFVLQYTADKRSLTNQIKIETTKASLVEILSRHYLNAYKSQACKVQ